MIKAMTSYLKELGGDVHLGAPVGRIETGPSGATGIELAGGK